MNSAIKSLFIVCILFNFIYSSGQEISDDSSQYYIKKGVEYFYSNDYINCEKFLQKALEIRLNIYDPNSSLIGSIYNNLGVLYMNTWEFENAISYLEKAKSIHQLNNLPIKIANTNSNLGAIYRLTGNLDLAEQYFTEALNLLEGLNTKEANQRKAEVLNRLGLLETQRKNYIKAIAFYQKAILNYENDISNVTLHNLYDNLAKCFIETSELDKANKILLKALILSQTSNELSPINEAFTIHLLTMYYINANNKIKANRYLEDFHKIIDSNKVDSLNYLTYYLDYAEYHSVFNDYNQAITYYQKALSFLTKKNLNNSLSTPDAKYFINPIKGIEVIRNKSNVLLKHFYCDPNEKYLQEAVNGLKVAIELIDNSRNSFLSMESKLALAENESQIYQMGLYASNLLYNKTFENKYLEQAFQFSEKSKSSILEGSLQEQKAKTFGGIPDSLLKKEEEYKRNIAFYKEQLHTEQSKYNPDSSKIKLFKSNIFKFSEAYEKFKNKLEAAYPKYYKLKYTTTFTPLKEIRQKLKANTTLLEYTLTDSALYVFQINKHKVKLKSKQVDSTLYKNIFAFLNLFKEFNHMSQGNSIFSDYQQTAFALYQELFDQTDTESLKENLIIVPDNILSYLPFEALVKSNDNTNPQSYNDLDYLNTAYTFSYSYSAHLFSENEGKSQRKLFNRALSVAPLYEKAYAGTLNNQEVFRNQRNNLLPLPNAKKEAEFVCRLTHGTCIIGKEATEENFIHYAPDFSILHLAMHTIIDDNNPLFSKLVFYSDSNNVEEGFLTTNEIFSLNLNANMTVLSACSSGEGEFKKGEGVFSLARSFFYAGCPSLLMTLWSVEDESGLTLMECYYKYLRRGYSKPKALQKAKIDYLKTVPSEKQHPFYWANYICIGNVDPLYFSVWHYVAFALALFAVLFSITRIKNRLHKKKRLEEPKLGQAKAKQGPS